MKNVKMMSSRQDRSARMRLYAKDVEIVPATIGGHQKHSRWIETHCTDGFGVGEKMSDYRIVAVDGNWSSRRRADVLYRMFNVQYSDDTRLASICVDISRCVG